MNFVARALHRRAEVDPDVTTVERASAVRAPVVSPEDAFAVLSLVRRLALQTSIEGAQGVLQHGIADLLGAHRAMVLFHDPATGAPWQGNREPRIEIAEDEHVLFERIAADGNVLAVVAAVRRGGALFGAREHALLALVAERCAPFLWQLAIDDAIRRSDGPPSEDALFRQQALERHRAGHRDGEVAQISPRWVGSTYWILLTGVGAGLLFGALARIHQYSSGPAVVRIEGAEVNARAEGTVERVGVVPGQRVDEGAVLIELNSGAEEAELQEIRHEVEQQLATFLLEPSDVSVRSSLASVLARKARAEAVVELRTVRAPRAGAVSDVRVRHGAHLAPGDPILTIVAENAHPTVVALLPGGDRPRLRPGMTLHLEIPGYEKTRERAVVDTIGEEVIGPQEARRYLGDKIADALPIDGSVVLVRARLPSRTFTARDKTYSFHDGMVAKAEVSVRARAALVALLPGLEKLW